jgi:hypothetical protein
MLPLGAACDWAEHVVIRLNVTQSLGSNKDDLNVLVLVEEFMHQFEQQKTARQQQHTRSIL